MSRRISFLTLITILLVVGGAALSQVAAETNVGDSVSISVNALQTDTESEIPPPTDAYCLLCHTEPDRTWVLPSGESLSLTIDSAILEESVHGAENPEGALACVDCHQDHRFPHTTQTIQNVREFKLERYAVCRTCHEDQYTHTQDSVHGTALREGQLEAAVCVDCHGGHDIQPPDEPRQRVSFTCGQCHGAIFDEYRNSIHGSALLEDGNPDVPTCTDCHGVHDIQNPTANLFRVRSPQLCANCHADAELMTEYGISTNVFDSYLTDFHGSTVELFEQQDPDVATNKAVCYDCHGVHNILAVDDDNSQVIRENLLTTCLQCHPDATSDFPNAWVGHFAPTQESHPLLYIVNTFYLILIPVVIGGFILLIATDIFRRIRQYLFKN